MNTIYNLISLLYKNRSWSLLLFRIYSHGTIAIYFSQNINIPFPDVLFKLKLFKKESYEYSHLGFNSFLDDLQLCYDLLNLGDKISTVTCFFWWERILFWDFYIFTLWNLHLISLFYMSERDIRAFESDPDLVKLKIKLTFNLSLF